MRKVFLGPILAHASACSNVMTSSNASSTSVTYQPINLDVNSLHDFFRVSCNTPNQTTAFLQAVTPQTTDCNPGGEYVAVEIPDDTSCEVVFLRRQNSFSTFPHLSLVANICYSSFFLCCSA